MAAVTDIVTSTGVVIVKCIVRWLYDQVAELLQKLKTMVESAIAFIDRQVDALRMFLSQADILAKMEETLWNLFEGLIEEIKNKLFGNIPGPDANLCPEFYEFLMAPFRTILDGYVDIFSVYRERWKGLLSFMDEVDYLISYWESAKAYLLALLEVLDDAVYMALENAATEAETAMRNG